MIHGLEQSAKLFAPIRRKPQEGVGMRAKNVSERTFEKKVGQEGPTQLLRSEEFWQIKKRVKSGFRWDQGSIVSTLKMPSNSGSPRSNALSSVASSEMARSSAMGCLWNQSKGCERAMSFLL
jgi:hypothetical protein